MRLATVFQTLFHLRYCSSIISSHVVLRRRGFSTTDRTTTITRPFWGVIKFDPSNPTASALHSYNLNELCNRIYANSLFKLPANLSFFTANFSGNYNRLNPANQNQLHLVKTLIEDGDLDAAADITRQSFSPTDSEPFGPFLDACDLVLESMYKVGRYEDVEKLFHFYFYENPLTPSSSTPLYPSPMSYFILVQTHFETGHLDWALDIFDLATTDYPDTPYFTELITKCLVSANRISQAVTMATTYLKNPDSIVYNNLIYGFLELNDDIQTANKYLNELILSAADRSKIVNINEDAFVFATYMEYYFKRNMEKEALESYQSFLNHKYKMTPEACNQVLQVLVKYGKSVEANTLFENMLNARISQDGNYIWYGVNGETYNIMVNDCFRLGKVSEALSLFNKRKGSDKTSPEMFPMDALAYNNMIMKLCDIGMLAEAEKIFQEAIDYKQVKREYPTEAHILRNLPEDYGIDPPSGMTNVTTFKILFNAYFKEGSIDKILKWFKFLLFETSLKPSYVLVNSVLSRLITKGKIEDVVEILGKMCLRDTEAFSTSYELVVTELCKGGNFGCVLYLVGLMVRYKVGITPTLYNLVCETIPKKELMDSIGKLLLKRPIESSCANLQSEQPAGDELHAPVS